MEFNIIKEMVNIEWLFSLILIVLVQWGYFDGAQNNGLCGAGMVLKLDEFWVFNLWMGACTGTNIRAYLLALWSLLWFVIRLWILHVQIVGDSKVIID